MKKISDDTKKVTKRLSFPNPGTKEWILFALMNMRFSTSRSIFHLLAGINRPIKPSQVTVLSKSVEQIMCNRPIIVAYIDFLPGPKGYYIIDGQHLFFALIRLDSQIPYVEIPIKNKQELVEAIALFNATSKSWTMQDYVTAWSNLHPDYVKLNDYFQQYDFELNILASILANTEINTASTKLIKQGTFRIRNENQAKVVLDYMTDIFKVLDRGGRYETKYLCSEYFRFYRGSKSYNHQKFMQNLRKNKSKLDFAVQESGKLAKVFQSYC